MGLDKLQAIYDNSGFKGLPYKEFADTLISEFNTPVVGVDNLQANLPKSGPVIIVANHPFGCIEGIALASEVMKIRGDVKVLANKALAMFQELQSLFIFIDPLKPKEPTNMKALKDYRRHLNSDGVLILFPSGKVSEFESSKKRVCDGDWNSVVCSCNAVLRSEGCHCFL